MLFHKKNTDNKTILEYKEDTEKGKNITTPMMSHNNFENNNYININPLRMIFSFPRYIWDKKSPKTRYQSETL